MVNAPSEPAKEQATAPRVHLGYLDGLRALAALYVIFYHVRAQIDSAGMGMTGIAKMIGSLFVFGHYAVDLFIVLSGFCLMLPVLRSKQLKGGASLFFKRRARRILPPYYLALTFSLLLITFLIGKKTGGLWDFSIPVTSKGVVSHLLLVQDAFRDTWVNINPSLWSVSVECHIYLFFPLLLWGWRKFGAIKTTLATLVGSYILLHGLHHYTSLFADPSDGAGMMPQYLGLFSLGMLGASIAFAEEEAMQALRKHVPWQAVMFVLAFMVLLLWKLTWHGDRVPFAVADLFVGGWALALLVFISGDHRSKIYQFLSCRPLVFLGTFAYSIYLIHQPVLQVLYQYLLQPLHLRPMALWIAQCLFGIPAIVAFAYGFYLLCERPFLNRYVGRTPAVKA